MIAIGIATFALFGSIVAPSVAAVAQPSVEPAPAPRDDTIDVPRAAVPATTVQTDPVDFSPTGVVTVRGSKQPGNGVTVTVKGLAACSVASDQRTEWECRRVAVPNGSATPIVATETVPSGSVPAAGTTAIDSLAPPTLDGSGSLVTTGLVSGVGRPGARITLSVDARVDARCADVPVEDGGFWSCATSVPSGRYFMRAQQSDRSIGSGRASNYSNAQDVVVDRDAPASAVITSPAAGSRLGGGALAVVGTGEDGASIDVYLDDTPACSTHVAGSAWSCTIGAVQRGDHVLQAIQRDVAGNYAPPSPAVTVAFVGAAAATTPKPRPRPVAPAPTPEPVPAPQPPPAAEAPRPSPQNTPVFPRPDGSAPTVGEALTNWSTPTTFASGLGSLTASVSRNWYTAPLVALLFVALVALPLRMLVTALRGRMRRPRARFTGRNRGFDAATTDAGALPRPWVTVLLPFAATAGLIALSVGVGGEVRYLRLLLAIAVGLALLNLVGGAVATRLGSRWVGTVARLRFMPLMLLAAAITALVSRWTGLEPPVITGVLIGAAFAHGVPARLRARASLVQVGTVASLGVLGWIALELVRAASVTSGFVGAMLAETLATVCLAGLGSALVLMLPVASLPGRAILEWSRPAWTGSMLAVSTIVALVIVGDGPTPFALVPWVLAALAFAALSLAVWAYVRFVGPQTIV